jgi:hypothetical protein
MTTTTRTRPPRAALCLAAGLAAAPVFAQEFQPYPTPKITVEQWVRYAEEVRQNYESTAEILKGQHLVAFSDPRTRTFYIFTTKDHAAHPAWITRQLVEDGGQVRVRQIGYFAGSEEAFAKLFQEYQARNAQLLEDVQLRIR